tara:strand:+ start:503 stop:1009 length:507 start_codon:yes stop_codon:yes gene_type:complete
MSKQHWRTFHETEFLGASDLQEKEIEELIVKIDSALSKVVKDEKGRDEIVLTCSFEGITKPMILNATNCKAIEKVSGSPFIENWKGTNLTIFIKTGIKAFGKVVDGLRVREFAPKIAVPIEEIQKDVDSLNKCKTIEELKAAFLSCKHQNDPKVVSVKEKMKEKCLVG